MNSVEESDVGITCFISKLPGFRGILKQRYSDFIVNEVDLNGNVVHLTSLVAPAEAMHNFFKENLKFLVTDTVDGPDTSSKSIRVRLNSGGTTGRGRNSKKRKERGDKSYDSRGSNNWPEHLGKFLRFHLYKENKDTQEAIGLIGKMLGIQPQSFGFAGTKDKRSISTQRVTLYKLRASRLAALNERLIGIKIGDFCHVNEGLLLGQLYGNRFTITLRGVIADSDESVKASADGLEKHGFINYFGLQRFGSGSVPTHLIGATLFRGEWKAAVSMILDPREGDVGTQKDYIREVREYYKESDDIEGTLKQLPRHLVAERAILQCLKKSPGNYLLALKAIPRTLRMMYVHSYQSYLWNHAASMRVQKYGIDRVVLGDLVQCKEEYTRKITEVSNSEFEDESCNDTFDFSHLDDISDTTASEVKSNLVKAITQEDLLAGDYTVDDVVLPLPGSRVIYPLNDIGKVYHDLAKKDDVSLIESVHSVKEFSLTSMTGAYRRVFQKPQDFEWEMLTYSDGNIPLAETDLDIVARIRPETVAREESANGNEDVKHQNDHKQSVSFENNVGVSTDNNILDNDRKDELHHQEFPAGYLAKKKKEFPAGSNVQEAQKAIRMSFTLPSSCYATMAIRELLKTSTSVAYHKTLNQ